MDAGRDRVEAVNALAANAVAEGHLPAEDQLPGVKALDLWYCADNGGVLFLTDSEPGPHGWRGPTLHDVYVRRVRGEWQASRGASSATEPLDEILRDLQPGLHYLNRSSSDRVFLTSALATPEVAAIRLYDDAGGAWERPPGRHGVVLLGVTSDVPLTHAFAVDRAGEKFAVEPLTLWAPPRG